MDTIIGKFYFLYFIAVFPLFMHARVNLEVRNADGIKTEHIVVGQPCTVEVTIDEINGSVSAPTIHGLEQFKPRRTGMYMSTINGVSSTKYTYQMTMDQLGTFTIGPAKIMHQQKELLSNTVNITVGNDDVSHATHNQRSSQKELKAFLRLTVDNDDVVVGQKIHVTLRFYYQDSGLTLTDISQPDLSAFDIQGTGKPVGGTADVNGIAYRYAEWSWDMYPTKAGEIAIPAYSVDYEFPVQDNRLRTSFFMLLNNRTERKRIYSNALMIVVHPLPYSSVPAQAVGTFDDFTATLSPAIAKEGEGMILTLEVSGDGNMKSIQLSNLNMPSELKWYDSTTTMVEPSTAGQLTKKRFEFVVQGIKAGEWEIPEQSFTYFDINKHAYVTLKTLPLALRIIPGIDRQQVANVTHQSKTEHFAACQEDVLPLNITGLWYPVSSREPLSWFLFYLLLIMPLMYGVYLYGYMHVIRIVDLFYGFNRRVCMVARKKINQCARTGESSVLYSIFVELFACLTHKNTHEMSAEIITRYIHQKNFSQQECREWDIFFERIAKAAYACHDKDSYELCRMAVQWINQLIKRV